MDNIKGLIFIYKGGTLNSNIVVFNNSSINLLNCKEIILFEQNDLLIIKRPCLDDNKFQKISKRQSITFTPKHNDRNLIVGEYYIEGNINDDEFILKK